MIRHSFPVLMAVDQDLSKLSQAVFVAYVLGLATVSVLLKQVRPRPNRRRHRRHGEEDERGRELLPVWHGRIVSHPAPLRQTS